MPVSYLKYILWLLIVAPTLLLAMSPGFTFDSDVKSVRIPVEIKHNIILLPLRINGSFEMNFILDTGVKSTILTETMIAGFLGLDSISPVRVRGLGGGDPINAIMARDVGIVLPGVTGQGANLIVLPEGVISYSGMFGLPVYGIIGYEIFGQFVVEINYAQKYIVLHDPFSFKPKRKHTELPLIIRRSKPYVMATIIDELGNEVESEWLLDTGASQAVALFHEEVPIPEQTIHAFLGQGLSGGVFGQLGRVKGFRFGDFHFEGVIAGYPDTNSLNLISKNADWYGNLGAEILSRFYITLDYGRQKLYLRKNSHYKKPFTYNVSGLEITTIGADFDRFQIIYVRPESPAAKSGVLVGDELISINSLAVEGLDIDQVYSSLSRNSRSKMKLRITRKEEEYKFIFRLIPEI